MVYSLPGSELAHTSYPKMLLYLSLLSPHSWAGEEIVSITTLLPYRDLLLLPVTFWCLFLNYSHAYVFHMTWWNLHYICTCRMSSPPDMYGQQSYLSADLEIYFRHHNNKNSSLHIVFSGVESCVLGESPIKEVQSKQLKNGQGILWETIYSWQKV